jgi:hypothetical protein
MAAVAKALGISAQSIYTWRRQDESTMDLTPGLSSPEKRNWRRRGVGSPSWDRVGGHPPGRRAAEGASTPPFDASRPSR